MRYDPSEIKQVPWPQWTESDGLATRRWIIELASLPAPDALAGLVLGDEEVTAVVGPGSSGRLISIEMATRGPAYSDDLYFERPRQMFRRIEAALGPIVTIQGWPRRDWR